MPRRSSSWKLNDVQLKGKRADDKQRCEAQARQKELRAVRVSAARKAAEEQADAEARQLEMEKYRQRVAEVAAERGEEWQRATIAARRRAIEQAVDTAMPLDGDRRVQA